MFPAFTALLFEVSDSSVAGLIHYPFRCHASGCVVCVISLCRLSRTTLRYPPFFPLPRFDGKAPLLAVLVVPFVLQVVAAVGLTGYLSTTMGNRSLVILRVS
jgi:hypothetical protein